MEEESRSRVCAFAHILDTCDITKKLHNKELTVTRISTINKCSKEREDGFEGKINVFLS